MTTVNRADLGANAWIVDEMYREYLENPANVSESWREFFVGYRPGASTVPPAPTAQIGSAPTAPPGSSPAATNGSPAPAAAAAKPAARQARLPSRQARTKRIRFQKDQNQFAG